MTEDTWARDVVRSAPPPLRLTRRGRVLLALVLVAFGVLLLSALADALVDPTPALPAGAEWYCT